jgi:hypothetical protein
MTIWHSIVMPDCHGRPDWSARRVWSNNIDSLIDNVSLAGRAVGRSPACRDLLKKAIQVAATDVTTCLQGELKSESFSCLRGTFLFTMGGSEH